MTVYIVGVIEELLLSSHLLVAGRVVNCVVESLEMLSFSFCDLFFRYLQNRDGGEILRSLSQLLLQDILPILLPSVVVWHCSVVLNCSEAAFVVGAEVHVFFPRVVHFILGFVRRLLWLPNWLSVPHQERRDCIWDRIFRKRCFHVWRNQVLALGSIFLLTRHFMSTNMPPQRPIPLVLYHLVEPVSVGTRREPHGWDSAHLRKGSVKPVSGQLHFYLK